MMDEQAILDDFLAKFLTKDLSVDDLAAAVSRDDVLAPVLTPSGDVRYTPAVYLDNAGSLPILKPINAYARILEERYRSNVGRSYGYQETVMRMAYNQARVEAARFFRARPDSVAILGSNVTTLFLSLLKHIRAAHPRGKFLLSPISHSALSVPIHNFDRRDWSYLSIDQDLRFDLVSVRQSLETMTRQGDDVTLAIETVSNLTGYETNWRDVIALAEEFGARVILDNAQGACFVDVGLSDYRCDVYVGVSGHKMGARDGSAVLVGPNQLFDRDVPLEPTGGMIFNYTEDREFYLRSPLTLEAGTPNYVAQASLAAAMRVLTCVGKDAIRKKIASISLYLAEGLQSVPGIKVFGSSTPQPRYGSVPFIGLTRDSSEISSMALAACLSYFHGVQVRANHHCAPVLIQILKGIPNDAANEVSALAQSHVGKRFSPSSHALTKHLAEPADPLAVLQTVRASASFGTSRSMVDAIVRALHQILANDEYKKIKVGCNPHIGASEYQPAVGNPEALKALLQPRVKFEDLLLSSGDKRREEQTYTNHKQAWFENPSVMRQ